MVATISIGTISTFSIHSEPTCFECDVSQSAGLTIEEPDDDNVHFFDFHYSDDETRRHHGFIGHATSVCQSAEAMMKVTQGERKRLVQGKKSNARAQTIRCAYREGSAHIQNQV